MSAVPDDWSVDVEGAQVVVRSPRTTQTEHFLTPAEARSLRNQLHVAYLVAWRDVDSDSGNAPDSESNETAVSAAMLPALNEADELPTNWRIADKGQSVELSVPASAADGEFTLSVREALAIGRALLRHAGRAQLARLDARWLAIEETSGTLDAAFGPDYLCEEREGWDE